MDITYNDIHDAVTHCEWRQDVCGVYVCKGQLGACSRIIDAGQCSTLQELFSKEREKDDKQRPKDRQI